MQPSALRRHQSGLTLIELVMTVSVLAIIVGIGVPGFRGVLLDQQLVTAVNSYVGSFQQARLRAVSRGGQVVICPSSDGQTCSGGLSWEHGWLIYDDANRNRSLDADETVVAVFGPLRDGLTATSSTGRPQLVYRSDGSSGGSNLRLTLCDQRGGAHARSIVVNNAGRPRAAPDEAGRCGPSVG